VLLRVNFHDFYAFSSNCTFLLLVFHKFLEPILIIKANEMHYFSNLFDKVLYMFQTGPLSIISSISILYTHNRCLSW